MNNIANAINLINISYGKKRNKVNIVINKEIDIFLKFLLKEGYIFYYKKINSNLVWIYLNYNKSKKSVLFKINLMYKPTNILYYNVSNLLYLKKKSNKKIYVIRTSFGFYTLNQCIEKNIGGYLFCNIE